MFHGAWRDSFARCRRNFIFLTHPAVQFVPAITSSLRTHYALTTHSIRIQSWAALRHHEMRMPRQGNANDAIFCLAEFVFADERQCDRRLRFGLRRYAPLGSHQVQSRAAGARQMLGR